MNNGAKEIVGVRHYSFTGKSGEVVESYDVYLEWEDERTEGKCCEHASIRAANLRGYTPTVGDLVVTSYNRWQKVDSLFLVM